MRRRARSQIDEQRSRALQLSLLLSTPFPGDCQFASGFSLGTDCTSHARTLEAQTVSAWDANILPYPASQRSRDRWTRTKYMTDNSHAARKCASDSSAVQAC